MFLLFCTAALAGGDPADPGKALSARLSGFDGGGFLGSRPEPQDL